MVRYLLKVHQGIKGHVMNSNGNIIPGAEIIVENNGKINEKIIKSSERGEYWRLLSPGTYKIKAKFQDFESDYHDIVIEKDKVEMKDIIVLPVVTKVNRGNLMDSLSVNKAL